MQPLHIVCGESKICHDLVLDKNINNIAYSTPLQHESLDVYHKMIMLVIYWYHKMFSLCWAFDIN